MSALKREAAFQALVRRAKACRLCPRMEGSARVIGLANGSLHSPLLIIGEAPGRLGADASAIPFHGDKAGENFETLLEQVGLSRHDCFITNAALCNPKDEKGNNATPNRPELLNCSGFLKTQIDLVSPEIVVTLGRQALSAISEIEPHDLELATAVRKSWEWYGRMLIPLYHPGQRAMVHRSFFNQLADYQFLAETYRRKLARPRPPSGKPPSLLAAQIACDLLRRCGGLTYFALHKLFYLAECEYVRRHGARMSGCYIVRQKDGPYVTELHIRRLKKALDLELTSQSNKLWVGVRGMLPLFGTDRVALPQVVEDVTEYVAARYGRASDTELKRVVYLSAPMRHILTREKRGGENMFNAAVDFSVVRRGYKDDPSALPVG